MSTAQSGSPSPVAAASNHWAPHGPLLTACLVGINVLMILLILFYFWRFFSGKPGSSSPAGADDVGSSADTSPATSLTVSRRLRGPDEPDIASSLPVSVYSISSDGPRGKAAECAPARCASWSSATATGRASSRGAATGSTPRAWTRGCSTRPHARSAAQAS